MNKCNFQSREFVNQHGLLDFEHVLVDLKHEDNDLEYEEVNLEIG